MVYAHRVQRVTISGTMFGGAEEWSTGFFLGQEGSDAADATDLTATAILNAWRTFFEAPTSYISSLYLTTQVKVAAIAADGHTELDEVHYAYPATTLDGAVSSAVVLPPQCTVVVTLLSDRPRGKASKGRMYLPGIAAMVNNVGKLSTSNAGTIADNMKTFFDTLAGSFDVPDQLILAARGTGPVPGLTAQNDFVESLRVGDVIDTQRRRRNGLAEVYTSRVLA